MRYSLDTNIVIAAMRGTIPVIDRLRHESVDAVGVSSIVLHELTFGAFNSTRVTENLEKLDRLSFPVLEFDADDARVAAEIRAVLKQRGTPIGAYDLLIAGQALARGLTIVTANVHEFERIDRLGLQNWTV